MSEKQITDADPRYDFIQLFNVASENHPKQETWNDFIIMSACLISNSADEKNLKRRKRRYLNTIRKYPRQEQEYLAKMFAYTELALNKNPEQDFLGDIYMSLGLSGLSNGQFYTNYKVSMMTAEYIFDMDIEAEVKDRGYVLLNDNACGSGSVLIAECNSLRKQFKEKGTDCRKYVCFHAVDNDEICGLIAYIQLSLLGMPGTVVAGDDKGIASETERLSWNTPILCGHYWMNKMNGQIMRA